MSLEESDRQAGEVAKNNDTRVTLEHMKSKIASTSYVNGYHSSIEQGSIDDTNNALDILTVCVIVTTEGFTLVGKSAPADPENFDADLGRKFAYEDALRQLWPLEGYLMRNKLHNES